MNRILSATALASLLVVSAQAAFADTTTAKVASPAAPSTASISISAPVVRPAVRIPGTFDVTEATQATIDQLYVLLPALSGNG